MGRFSAAKMIGAIDAKFQRYYNMLIDLLDTGYMTEKTINGKRVKISIDPNNVISVTVDGVKVFGVNSAGRVFAESISNISNGDYYMTYGYNGSPGLECFMPLGGVPVKFLGVSPDVSGGFRFYDKNAKLRAMWSVAGDFRIFDHTEAPRLSLWADGTMSVRDAAGNYIMTSSATDTQIKFGATTPDNRIGADETGPYYIKAGAKTYF